MPSVALYAELLANIRQISLYATLPTESTNETAIELDGDRHILTLRHNGEATTINLPGTIAASASVDPPSTGVKELSLRLPVTSINPPESRNNTLEDPDIVWPASSITPASTLGCKSCKAILVHHSVKSWRAMPNESWAEHMDFWHCHKPDTPHSSQPQPHVHGKGYSASNSNLSLPGVGLVNTTQFLLSRDDCSSLKVCETSIVLVETIRATRRRPVPRRRAFHGLVADTISREQQPMHRACLPTSLRLGGFQVPSIRAFQHFHCAGSEVLGCAR